MTEPKEPEPVCQNGGNICHAQPRSFWVWTSFVIFASGVLFAAGQMVATVTNNISMDQRDHPYLMNTAKENRERIVKLEEQISEMRSEVRTAMNTIIANQSTILGKLSKP